MDTSKSQLKRITAQHGIRRISEIARDIETVWGPKVNFAARPYLDAMHQIEFITDHYYADSAESVVLYFLANAQTFRGEAAKALKAELKTLLELAR